VKIIPLVMLVEMTLKEDINATTC